MGMEDSYNAVVETEGLLGLVGSFTNQPGAPSSIDSDGRCQYPLAIGRDQPESDHGRPRIEVDTCSVAD